MGGRNPLLRVSPSAEFFIAMALSYTVVKDWFREGDGVSAPSGLEGAKRSFVFSRGSMTQALEGLLGSRVSVELSSIGTTTLSAEEARLLGEEEGAGMEAFERMVWLKAGGRRLLFARSVIPVRGVEEGLLKSLDGPEPMGRVLDAAGLSLKKEAVEVGVLRCEDVSARLGVDGNTPLVARRYVLTACKPGSARPAIK